MLIRIALIVLAVGCTNNAKKGENPRQVLSEYVSRSFSVTAPPEKNRLLELTTGEVRKMIEVMDEGTFKNTFIKTRKEFLNLKIRDERKISDDSYSITYEITYLLKTDQNTGQNTDKVTHKKTALFEKKDSKWYITEVKNQKTMIEHQNEMSF